MAFGKSLVKSGAVSDYPKEYRLTKKGETRAEKRHSEHFVGRKNTRGIPIGYSKNSYDRMLLPPPPRMENV